jgi:tetratricopeptide (TPR) repeat protein
MSDVPAGSPADEHRRLAVEANNSTWELIDLDRRTPDEEEDMLRRAYAAAYHWARATGRTPANEARACWLLSRVQLLAGQPEPALRYGERCLAVCTEHGLADWDLAYAHEARGRALKALGRDDEALEAWARARAVPVVDAEDREHLERDLATGP